MKRASEMVEIAGSDHLETLRRCGGFYKCPVDEKGKRLGPLVGYAGTYVDYDHDGKVKQKVGDIYANFAMAEMYPHVLRHFARTMRVENFGNNMPPCNVLCGAPIGGYSFADALGLELDCRVVKAEKKITAFATQKLREQSELVFSRHSLTSRDEVVIVEDVCNNFSTTDQLIQLIRKSGGEVVAIVCLLNRSLTVDHLYFSQYSGSIELPVICLVRLPMPEYRQEELEVVEDIIAGNVVLKPKNEWPRLMAAMEAAEKNK